MVNNEKRIPIIPGSIYKPEVGDESIASLVRRVVPSALWGRLPRAKERLHQEAAAACGKTWVDPRAEGEVQECLFASPRYPTTRTKSENLDNPDTICSTDVQTVPCGECPLKSPLHEYLSFLSQRLLFLLIIHLLDLFIKLNTMFYTKEGEVIEKR